MSIAKIQMRKLTFLSANKTGVKFPSFEEATASPFDKPIDPPKLPTAWNADKYHMIRPVDFPKLFQDMSHGGFDFDYSKYIVKAPIPKSRIAHVGQVRHREYGAPSLPESLPLQVHVEGKERLVIPVCILNTEKKGVVTSIAYCVMEINAVTRKDSYTLYGKYEVSDTS